MKISYLKIKYLFFVLFITWVNLLYSQQTGPNNPDYCLISQANNNVNLITGDLHYTLPLFTVPGPEGGFSLDLSYLSGITYDQEASWVGLGWNMFPGAINRNVNGFPDDWKSDPNASPADLTQIEYDINGMTEFMVINNPADNNYVSLGFQRIMGRSKNLLGYRKRLFDLSDQGLYNAYGSLYFANARNDTANVQSKNYLMDVYHLHKQNDSEGTAESDKESVADIEMNSCLTLPNYDEYMVSTPGISGSMSIQLFECGNITGERKTRYEGSTDGEIKYHYKNATDGFSRSLSNKYFYFNDDNIGYLENTVDDITYSTNDGDFFDYTVDTLLKSKLPNCKRYICNLLKNIINNFNKFMYF